MAAPAVSYEVRWREAGTNTAWRSQRFPANSTVITIPGLTRGKTYEGDARSIGAQGETSLWVPVTFSIGMPTYVPKPPENMVVLPAPNGVNLSWEVYDGNRPDTIYVIERRPPGGEWQPVGQTPGNSIYIPVEDDVAYEWRVYAKDWQDYISEFTAAVTQARQHVADMVDLANETLERIQGDADEAAARAAGDAAEALARSEALLDLETELTAQITNESVLRESADENLASQIANISAGSGEQFDSDFIWYFDTTPEGWTAAVTGSAPTAANGFMKPADNSVPGGVQSPVFDGTGNTYRTVKLRLKQTGNPAWQGYVWWQTDADATYTTGKRVSLPEPVFDPNGVATMDFKDIPWADDVNRIRVDLTSTQDASNYIEFDWIAVGRPSPGASMAALQEETTARITADQAEATARQNLASQMRGNYTGTDLALVTTGLIASEKTARTDADEAEATSREALSVKVTGLADPSGATLPTLTSGLIYDERTARASEDEALAEDITALDVRLDSAEGDISSQASALGLLTTRVTNAEGEIVAQGTAIDDLSARVSNTETGLSGAGDAIDALDVRVTATEDEVESQATQLTNLTATVTTVNQQMNALPGDNVLENSSFDGEELPIVSGTKPKFWTARLGGSGTGTGFVTSHVVSDLAGSTKAFRMEASSLATTRYMELLSDSAALGYNYKVTPGQKHTLSMWARGSVGNNIQMYIQYANAANAIIQTNTLTATPITADWKRYSLTGNAAPATAVKAIIYAVRMFGATGEPAAWVEIDNVQFQQGEVPNNYVPSVSVLSTATATALSNLDARTTANEDDITSQALAITSLAASITARGVNLVPDKYSFFDPAGPAPTISSVTQGTVARSNEQAYVSPNSMKMVSSGADQWFFFGSGSQYEITLQPGKKYLLSLFQYSSVANAQLQAQVVAANGDAKFVTFPAPVIATNTWGRNAVVIDLSTGVTATAWKLRIDNHAAAGVTTYIDGIMIEELMGTQTTPSVYSRGSTGTQVVAQGSAIQTLDTRVTSAEGNINANSNAITSLNSSVAGKADVSAVSALSTRVTQVEGSGNPNLLVNSSYNADLNGWSQGGGGIVLWARDAHGPTWQPPGMHTLVIGLDNNAATGTWASADSRVFGVEPGKTYIASAWLAAHRATIVGVQIIFADASGATILVPDSRGVVGGAGQNISDPAQWTRRYVAGVAPANARTAFVRCFFFKDAGTTSTPYLWILRPMLELARPNQTTPTDWGTGGFEMMASYVLNLDVNGYAAGFKVANDGTTSNFNILADNFAIVKPGGGARTEYSGGNWRVYDAGNVLRVRIGVW